MERWGEPAKEAKLGGRWGDPGVENETRKSSINGLQGEKRWGLEKLGRSNSRCRPPPARPLQSLGPPTPGACRKQQVCCRLQAEPEQEGN